MFYPITKYNYNKKSVFRIIPLFAVMFFFTDCQMLLDEEEIIVLEVAERAKMIAQQDGHDFALGHFPFAVSRSLISLVYGGNV